MVDSVLIWKKSACWKISQTPNQTLTSMSGTAAALCFSCESHPMDKWHRCCLCCWCLIETHFGEVSSFCGHSFWQHLKWVEAMQQKNLSVTNQIWCFSSLTFCVPCLSECSYLKIQLLHGTRSPLRPGCTSLHGCDCMSCIFNCWLT